MDQPISNGLLYSLTYLLWNFPHALHTAEHVAAPQHEAAKVTSEPMLGTARSGSDNNAPMMIAGRMMKGEEAEEMELLPLRASRKDGARQEALSGDVS